MKEGELIEISERLTVLAVNLIIKQMNTEYLFNWMDLQLIIGI